MASEKEITIYDLAARLHLSSATVSRALNDHPSISKQTKKRIQDLARELGYRSNTFASSLRTRRTHTIGVVVPKLNSNFVAQVLAGMEQIATDEGYNLIINQSLESGQKEVINLQTMFNSRVDGVLASLAYDTNDISHFQKFFDKNIPVVFFDRVTDHEKCLQVVIDNYRNGFEATRHLIEQGCKRIMHISANMKRNVYADRYRGYRDALSQNGITFTEELLLLNDLTEQAGLEAAHHILQMQTMPDGIFAANDAVAVHCLKTLKQAGVRIPEDIAIVGFNDDPISRVIEPNLTTIHYPGYKMGTVAITKLIRHLNGSAELDTAQKIVLQSELIIRASSRK